MKTIRLNKEQEILLGAALMQFQIAENSRSNGRGEEVTELILHIANELSREEEEEAEYKPKDGDKAIFRIREDLNIDYEEWSFSEGVALDVLMNLDGEEIIVEQETCENYFDIRFKYMLDNEGEYSLRLYSTHMAHIELVK